MSAQNRLIPFAKMHGAGNDFVVLDGLARGPAPGPRLASHAGWAIAISASGSTRCWWCAPGWGQISAWRSSTPTVPRWKCAPTAFGPFSSTCAMPATPVPKRSAWKHFREIVRPRWAGDDRVRVDMGQPVLAPAKIPTTLGSGEGPVLDVTIDVPPGVVPGRERSGDPLLDLHGKPPCHRGSLRCRSGPRADPGAAYRKSPGLSQSCQRRVRHRALAPPYPAAHLGAGNRRDTGLRKRRLRGGGERHSPGGCGVPQFASS